MNVFFALLSLVLLQQPHGFQSIHQSSARRYWEGVRFEGDSLVFRYFLSAGSVSIVGDFNRWDPGKGVMHKDSDGAFVASFKVKPGVYRYRLIVDGKAMPDPTTSVRINCPFRWFSALRVGEDGTVRFDFKGLSKLWLCLRP